MDFFGTGLGSDTASVLGNDPYGFSGASTIGQQTDGTNWPSITSLPAQPVDAGGGAPADYAPAILDVFKTGVQAWTAVQGQKNMLDYKKYETTAAGTFQQGQPALFARTANGGTTPTMFLIVIGIIGFALLTHKG